MECYSELTCAMFVDGELAAGESKRLREHMAKCQHCRRLVDALRAENRILGEILHELPEEAVTLASVPRLRWSWLWGDLAAVAAVLALGSIFSFWIGDLRIPETLEWLNPFSVTGIANLMLNISYYFARGGTAMLTEYAAGVGGFFLLLLLGGGALLLGRRWRLKANFGLVIVVLAISLQSFALESRHANVVTVSANETVDDSLLATGGSVRVEGVVNGDLLAFSRTVEIRGTVKGDVISFARSIMVSGNVEGRIFTCSRSLDLEGQLGHSIYGWMQSLRVDNRGHVGEGIVVGADEVTLEGEVKRGANLYAGNADISGSIGRDLTMAGGSLTLNSTARVGGNLKARVRHLNEVHIADGATIAGKRDIEVRVRKSRYTRPKFYFFQAVWLGSAMLVGWLALTLFPKFFQTCAQAVGAGWRSFGLGLGVLAATPVAIIVVAITVVGLPLSLISLAAYLVSIYLTQILVGAFLGRILLRPTGSTKHDWLLGLLVGLVILTIAGHIPYLGGLVHLGVICLGLGAFAWQLYLTVRQPVAA